MSSSTDSDGETGGDAGRRDDGAAASSPDEQTERVDDGSTDRDGEPVDRFTRAELVADIRELVTAIEAFHPDPYVGYDGRVHLHRKLQETIRDLPETATVEEFYRRAAPLVAGLDDAHSLLRRPESTGRVERSERVDDHRLPLSVRVVDEELYVESVADESLADLLGARLTGVEDESVEALADRGARFRGAENRYTALSYLGACLEGYASLDRLFGRSEPPAESTVEVELDGERRRRSLAPVSEDTPASRALSETVDYPSGVGPRYRLYEGGDAAVFVPGNLQGYRETLEAARDRDADVATELAPELYDRMVGGDPPGDVDEIIAALPSMVETLTCLVRSMAAAGTDALIVDLRDNPGGDSQFVNHVAYVLEGWDGVARITESLRAVKRRTDPHRERYGTAWFADESFGTAGENPADYDFSGDLDARTLDREELVDRVRDLLTSSDTFAGEARDGRHEAYYRPEQVVVVTTAGTMSSGFAGAAQLRSLGADVVGVPSGQAPLSYGEPVNETLSNTGLTARIAGSMYHWIPDPDDDVLTMDRVLTSERFEEYGRAGDAALRLAFDHAGITESGEVPEPAECPSRA